MRFLLNFMLLIIRQSTKALLRGLQLLIEVKAIAVEIFGDSELVINQLSGQYECKNNVLREYYEECRELLKNFLVVTLHHIPREYNEEANKLAQAASGYRESGSFCYRRRYFKY